MEQKSQPKVNFDCSLFYVCLCVCVFVSNSVSLFYCYSISTSFSSKAPRKHSTTQPIQWIQCLAWDFISNFRCVHSWWQFPIEQRTKLNLIRNQIALDVKRNNKRYYRNQSVVSGRPDVRFQEKTEREECRKKLNTLTSQRRASKAHRGHCKEWEEKTIHSHYIILYCVM